MADVKDILQKAQHELDMGKHIELVSWKQAYALLGIGYALLANAMIVEDVETGDEDENRNSRTKG